MITSIGVKQLSAESGSYKTNKLPESPHTLGHRALKLS